MKNLKILDTMNTSGVPTQCMSVTCVALLISAPYDKRQQLSEILW